MSIEDSCAPTKDLLFHSDDWLTAGELDRRFTAMGSHHSAFELERQHRIFSIERDGVHYFATYQFDADVAPLPIVREILVRLGDANSWTISAWFHFPNCWIALEDGGQSPVAPKDALDRRDEVLYAAERYGGTYVA